MALPKNLLYQNKIESAYSRSYTTHVQPTNSGSFSDGQTIMFNIPTSSNLVMDSNNTYLKFDLKVTNGAGANAYIRLDKGGAHGIIKRIRVYSGSNLLEDLDGYGNLVANLRVLQQSSACAGKESILSGFSNELACNINDASVADAGTLLTKIQAVSNLCVPVISGERLIDDAQTTPFADIAANGDTLTRTYCINLMSIVGSLSSKYLPLFSMSSSPVRLELQLENSPAKFCCSEVALASFTVNNAELICAMMELGDTAISIIQNSLMGQPLQFVVPSYRNYQFTAVLGTSQTKVNIPTPAKFNSLKSLLCTMRSKSGGANTFFPHGSNHFNLSEFNCRLGSKVVPSKSPASVPEFFTELCKSVSSLADLDHEPMINIDNYDAQYPVANTETESVIQPNTTSSSSFMIGLDLESFSSSDKSQIFSGYNSISDDIYLNVTHSGQGGATTVQYDVYGMYDQLMVCENGVCEARF